jgi:murein DD-endopeptidase MepM/ murein hydrolase activator NlpD
MHRSGSVSGLKADTGAKTPNQIDNTALTSDLSGNVNETFTLTPNSTRTAIAWEISVNGTSGLAPLTELTWNPSTGQLSGTVSQQHANQQYTVLITANDSNGVIDSREYNFYPKIAQKGEYVKFLFPLQGKVAAQVVVGFGPREPSIFGSSTQNDGIAIAMVDHSLGNVVSAADGTVVKVGPAPGYGNQIVIEHFDSQDNLVATTVYGHSHSADIYVKAGQKVSAGQKISLEGNAGIPNNGGANLYFELHKGQMRNPVNPIPYIDGTVLVASNNDPSILSQDGVATPTSFTAITTTNSGMTTGETQAYNNASGCSLVLPQDALNITPSLAPSTGSETPPAVSSNINPYRSACAPTSTPSVSTVISEIKAACAANPNLTAYDAQWIQTVAAIESSYDPYAKNPSSSATGLYQMLDSIAVKYYGVIGIPPTCANRCNVTYATQAYIAFYLDEIRQYWDGYVASGQTTIANLPINPTSWSGTGPKFYTFLNQGDFMYGLIQHDGVGNAVAGRDLGGVAYWRSKVGT